MTTITGKFNSAEIFTNLIEDTAKAQIKTLCDEEAFAGSKIRIMPDVHAGAGCVIGTTMTIKDKVVPNLVGVDIGCGMSVRIYDKFNVDFQNLDNNIRNVVPYGFAVHDQRQPMYDESILSGLTVPEHASERVKRSIGTLGGGNHFIELNEYQGSIYLVVHSGSRNLGTQIAEHHQRVAKKNDRDSTTDLEYLEGKEMYDYLNDMDIAQRYASINRKQMLENISMAMGWKHVDEFETIHNYIDLDNSILRKGAISAQEGERVIIPMNMRDGSIIAVGKGNADWNFSAPHGAGRLMGRGVAKRSLDMNEFTETMKGVWSSTISGKTLDEAPMAYKSMNDIISNVGDSLKIDYIIKPIYNFKAA